jgi:hypothetical protein
VQFTVVPVSKLAKFLELDEDAVLSCLFALKHKARSLRWKGGSLPSGVFESQAEVEFFVDKVRAGAAIRKRLGHLG